MSKEMSTILKSYNLFELHNSNRSDLKCTHCPCSPSFIFNENCCSSPFCLYYSFWTWSCILKQQMALQYIVHPLLKITPTGCMDVSSLLNKNFNLRTAKIGRVIMPIPRNHAFDIRNVGVCWCVVSYWHFFSFFIAVFMIAASCLDMDSHSNIHQNLARITTN